MCVLCRNLEECTLRYVLNLETIEMLITNNARLKKVNINGVQIHKTKETALSVLLDTRPNLLFTLDGYTYPHPHTFKKYRNW